MKKCRNILIVTEIISIVILIVYNILDEHADYNYKTIYRDGKIISTTWFEYVDDIVLTFAYIALILMLTVSVTGYILGAIKKKEIATGERLKNTLLILGFSAMIFFTDTLLSLSVTGLFTEEDYSPVSYEFSGEGNRIVITESSFLLMGTGTVYKVDDNGTARRIGDFSTDDGFRNNGNYGVKFTDKYVDITYDFGSGLDKLVMHTDRFYFE